MKKSLDEIKTNLTRIRNDMFQINNKVGALKHDDAFVLASIVRLKKVAMQFLDVFNAMERQANLVDGQYRSFEVRDSFKKKFKHLSKKELAEQEAKKVRAKHGFFSPS